LNSIHQKVFRPVERDRGHHDRKPHPEDDRDGQPQGSGGRYASVWSKKGFREGLTPPAAKGSDGEVLAAVKANPGSVGYVSKPSPDVKVLLKL
jgi:hypothetical protein